MYKLSSLLIILSVVGCSPVVEEVRYSDHASVVERKDFEKYLDQINHLSITVNTKQGLFSGRESFLSFTRDHYTFYFRTKSDHYSEADMIVRMPGLRNEMIALSDAQVEILKQ